MIRTACSLFFATMLIACSIRPANAEESQSATPDWVEAERGILERHVQLTFAEDFLRAGESYFSPDGSMIIFQAVETPRHGEKPEEHYQMFVSDVVYGSDGHIRGIKNTRRLSPPGSSNTCGWFHPTKPNTVIFGSTIVQPSDPGRAGFQREGKTYKWSFPKEMTIIECDLSRADGTAETLTPIVTDPHSYLAECVISSDGRNLVYCRRQIDDENLGGDLLIRNLKTGRDVVVADNDGYDGGPFFSPDNRRITYRSDRRGNDLLQIFIAELDVDQSGNVRGLAREFQLTDNAHVNWAPFWHPSGNYLVYTTSQMGHDNYEVFLFDSDPGDPKAGRPTKYGTRMRRVTHAGGFDGLPVFNADGSLMMWTAQRDADETSQIWVADFVMPLEETDAPRSERVAPRETEPREVHATDPDTGHIYIYDPATHTVRAYDPGTHKVRPVTSDEELRKVHELMRSQSH